MTSLEPLSQDAYEPGISIGIFQLDWETYRADPGINASALKKISKSVKFWEASKKQPDEPTDAMILGSLVHTAVLEPEKFGPGVSHHVRPPTYPDAKTGEAKKWSGNANFCKEWIESHSDLPIITTETLLQVIAIASAIMDDEIAGDFVENAHTEVSVFCNDPLTGERRKARLDLLAESEQYIYLGDLKKADDVDDAFVVARTFAKWKIHMQLSFYRDLLNDLMELFGIPKRPIRALAGCYEDSIAPELVWWELDPEGLMLGTQDWRNAIARYSNAKKTGTTPGYDKTEKIRTLKLPAYLLRDE